MTQIKDGWHKVYGEDVYVENRKVVRGVTKDANGSEKTCHPTSTAKTMTAGLTFLGKQLFLIIEQAIKKELYA